MRLPAKYVIVALAISTQGSCGGSDSLTGPSDVAVTFSGRVVEYRTQLPAVAVAVMFGPPLLDSGFGPSETTTNADGGYVLTVPRTGLFTVSVNGVFAGMARVNGNVYRGDLFIQGGTCISRYGIVIDRDTLRPIQGATLSLAGATATTGADGWYRIDLGCPDVILPGGTTVINVTHPAYGSRSIVVGRGVAGVSRLDLDLQRQ